MLSTQGKQGSPVLDSTAPLLLCLPQYHAVDLARGQMVWQPALGISHSCTAAPLQQQLDCSLYASLSSKVKRRFALHLEATSSGSGSTFGQADLGHEQSSALVWQQFEFSLFASLNSKEQRTFAFPA